MFTPPKQLRLSNAVEVAALGEQAIQRGEDSFNLTVTSDVDSSAIAVLVGWQRYARQRKQALQFSTLSPNLAALARLYDVHDLVVPNA